MVGGADQPGAKWAEKVGWWSEWHWINRYEVVFFVMGRLGERGLCVNCESPFLGKRKKRVHRTGRFRYERLDTESDISIIMNREDEPEGHSQILREVDIKPVQDGQMATEELERDGVENTPETVDSRWNDNGLVFSTRVRWVT